MNSADTIRIDIAGSSKFDTCVTILRKLGCAFDGATKTWETPAGFELKLEMWYMSVTNTPGAESTFEKALAHFGMRVAGQSGTTAPVVAATTPAAVAAEPAALHTPELATTTANRTVARTAFNPSLCRVCGGKVDYRETWARPGYCGCEGE